MAVRVSQGTIKEIEVTHKKHFGGFRDADGYESRARYARIVVWATTARGKRVWVRTVEGGLDPLNISIKIAMAQEFFKALVGKKIRFHKDEWGDTLFAEENSLPQEFLISYSEIKKKMWKWVEANRGEELNQLRKERSAKAAATRKENAAIKAEEEEWRAQMELRRQKELEERRKKALHLAFKKGRNPKYGSEQWEAWHEGRLYILRREDSYDPSEDKIPVEESFDLVPDRIVLVQRA